MRDGRLVDARAWGEVDVELKVRASTRHVFEIGSISKQFTAYAILILADEGRVDLDAPVSRYVDGLPDAWGRASLHALLTHTSGLPDLEAAFGYDVYRETTGDEAFLAGAHAAEESSSSPGRAGTTRTRTTGYWRRSSSAPAGRRTRRSCSVACSSPSA